MALQFPLNPNTNDTFTSGSSTWVFTGTSWESQGTSGTGGSGGGTTLPAGGTVNQFLIKASNADFDYAYSDLLLPDTQFRRKAEINFNGDYSLTNGDFTIVQQAEYITGNDWLYSPSANFMQRTRGSIFRRNTAGVYVLSGISHNNVNYQTRLNFKIGITFGFYQGANNPTHTFFVGTTDTLWGSSNNYLTNIASANASQLGFGYNEANANWQLCVPKFVYPGGLVDLGVVKPSTTTSFYFTMQANKTNNTMILKLYNLDTKQLILNETVNLNAEPTFENPINRLGYLPDYQRQVFHCYMSPGSTTSAQASLQINRTFYEMDDLEC